MAALRSNVILPVESQVRELDAKLLLACVAAERGFPVVLGSRALLHHRVAGLARGVYLAKSMRSLSDRMFRILRDLGHEIVAWDEEGLVRFPRPQYTRRRLSARAMREVSVLLAWGQDDARVFQEFTAYPGCPIRVTGNPRVDLMRPELRGFHAPEVERLRARFGDFVLVNTNFGGFNHFFPNLSFLQRALDAGPSEPVDPFLLGQARHRRVVFEAFQDLVPALADTLPDRLIVVRPHPSESHVLWKEIASGCRNVQVVNEGNVIPWLLAAQALVHNGCTTAVEAAVLGTPTVAFQPVTSREYDLALPNALSHRVSNVDGLCKTVRSITRGELGPLGERERRRVLAPHLAALEGRLAADRMVDVLEEVGYGRHRPPDPPAWRALRGRVHLRARRIVKQVNARRPGHRNHRAFHAHRFPGVSMEELEARMDRLAQQVGRFRRLRLEPVERHIFRIEGA